ncbi:16S rRNA (adenine(1518)-N(6)/adenine(1519)-N(6))-dimethyltransferase RsmA [Solitalea canadensis]|uniref:Ribosomal RNA small subunit methyltransferase A n=1 Tax=Solitalea canadensis (strain ATCC 29591 / DSM 3403 / JCM 21819 / LMG 8368 / NBRC 15130 / NCIMB 12057 / USAM 9D) TaxID=929556 RepID=H8KWR4_SOLCM|nr:16S rRNA (adenine(1518)-N(6)/adenine(1519)-N(6))-dimethyltransferase RsmA [Solitalea canadensis]AFD08243.1 dimethyladenosine transferase [Solitalea canadensis DSM 3403]
MSLVRAKKHLGQHFLTDKNIAQKIVESLRPENAFSEVLEVGPGMGVLTDFLVKKTEYKTSLIDIDGESIEYLHKKYPELKERIIHGDFLEMDFSTVFKDQFAIIGNFPYNISSQIIFKIIDNRDLVPEMVGMFQKEVGERVAAKPGGKEYGILSVLSQAFYKIEYLFTVKPGVFNPPPKVNSGVIRLTRKENTNLGCNEKLFFQVVKAAFNQRRKQLRNALSQFQPKGKIDETILELRAEKLTVEDFVKITQLLETK